MRALRYLNKYFLNYKYRLIIGLIITIIARIFATLVPTLVGDSVDVVEQYLTNEITDIAEVKSGLITNIALIAGALLISALFTFLMRQTFIVVSRFIEFDLKNEVFQHYQKLSLNFYKKNRTGDLMNRISEDVSKVRMYVGPAIMYSVNTFTLFIIVIGYMISIAPELTLYTVTPLPILSVLIYKLSVAIHHRSSIVQEFLSKLTTFTQESFSGITVIKAYGIESQTQKSFTDLSNISKDKNLDLAKVQALFFPLMVLLIGFSNILVIYIGGKQFINGTIQDLGVIVEFIIFVNMLTWPVATVGWVSSIVQQAEASQVRINEFLRQEPEITNTVMQHTPIKGNISFTNVSFIYDDTNITALQNINLEVKNGETIGITGKTGSGKSTLLDLIGRLYDVSSGEIQIGETPIRNMNLTDLRKQIGYVPQDAFLFSDSIQNNIKFGNEKATNDEVYRAAKNAVVHDNIIEFSKGYDTILGERGITLSGGQKQRVSIARAILKNPSILLFDDCLSAVDTETEEEILNNLHSISKNKTTFIVSHRISTIKNANKIIVLEDGKITQQGTHNQLINSSGYYKDLYLKQLSEKEI
ncbi:ABC transporter ATP-binding protein [Aquimarina longa]|uniref:ABC transporter ATP-binding protein n=1 Tax=Aquimarina longa TaxID=1080221 RepID=UPI000784FBCD|nr:ABC transporter ATP-binding protein [Aquimarina longa]